MLQALKRCVWGVCASTDFHVLKCDNLLQMREKKTWFGTRTCVVACREVITYLHFMQLNATLHFGSLINKHRLVPTVGKNRKIDRLKSLINLVVWWCDQRITYFHWQRWRVFRRQTSGNVFSLRGEPSSKSADSAWKDLYLKRVCFNSSISTWKHDTLSVSKRSSCFMPTVDQSRPVTEGWSTFACVNNWWPGWKFSS